MVSISVVLPAYNEAKNIEKTVNDTVSYLERKVTYYEIIVVNDGSVDGTREVVERLSLSNPKIVLVNHPINLGYGSALRSGFERASLDYIFFMDSDGQFDINDIDRFLRDIDCAFKLFPRTAYYDIRPIKSGGALFSAELIIKLGKKGFKIKEVPVRHFPRRFGKQTGANLKVILRMFKECWKLKDELKVL